MRFRLYSIGCVALALGVFVSCGSADNTGLFDVGAKSTSVMDSSNGAQAPAAEGASVAPTPGSHLWVTVNRIKVRLDADTWYTVFSGSRKLDLFDTAGVEVPLGAAPLPAGRITQLRLVLANRPEFVTQAGQMMVRCPSCAQSGLKLDPVSDLTLQPGDHVHASLRFDSDHSLFSTPQGYVLHPVIRVVLSRVTGSP